MASSRPRVLFLSHSASRNGASILLLNLLRWLQGKVDWDMEVLVHGSGPLIDDFRAAVPKTVAWRDPAPPLSTLFCHSMPRFRRPLEALLRRMSLPTGPYDLIYANTSASAHLVKLLKDRGRSVLWHVHELSYALKLTLRDDDLADTFRSATRFIAVSNSVKQTLRSDYGVPAEKIDLVNGFVPFNLLSATDRDARRNRMRDEMGLPRDAFVVGGCGSLGWRKGTDLFLQVAQAIASTSGYDDVHFLWIGGSCKDKESLEFEHDIRHLGLESRCRLVPTADNVLDYYCAMDVFALTSREDPFPLVMLEAAEQCLPVVCFERSGGGTEFVDIDCGVTVPYLDIGRFSAQIIRLHDETRLLERLGRCGQRKVHELYRVEVQGPKLINAAQQCLDESLQTTRQRALETT